MDQWKDYLEDDSEIAIKQKRRLLKKLNNEDVVCTFDIGYISGILHRIDKDLWVINSTNATITLDTTQLQAISFTSFDVPEIAIA